MPRGTLTPNATSIGRSEYPPSEWGIAAYTAVAINNSANDAMGTILNPPQTGNVTDIAFALGTVTTGATLDARIETVGSATGDPSGTLLGTNTNGSLTIAGSDANTIKTVTLTASASVTNPATKTFPCGSTSNP